MLTGEFVFLRLAGYVMRRFRVLTSVGTIGSTIPEGHLFATMPEAIAHARLHITAKRNPDNGREREPISTAERARRTRRRPIPARRV